MAEANERAATAGARAEEARLQLEKFRAPRTISTDQRVRINEKIKPFSGQEFSGMVALSVPDARALWEQIVTTMTGAGWILKPPAGLSIGEPPAGVPLDSGIGITVFVPKSDVAELTPAARALVLAFKEEGLMAGAAIDDGPQARPKLLTITIGVKPQ